MARPLTTEPPALLANFEDLYREFAGQVFAWARRYAGGRTGWAEDVTHDVFLRAWRHRDELRAADVKSWLYRVTQNRAFTLLRREGTMALMRNNSKARRPEAGVQNVFHSTRRSPVNG